MKFNSNQFLPFFITIAISIGLDQYTKVLAVAHIKGKGVFTYLWDTCRLVYAENDGAFLSLGSDLPDNIRFWALNIIPIIMLMGLMFYILFYKHSRYGLIALSLVFAGGISNIFDRFFNDGWVIDFLNMGIWGVRTGIFNIADVSIMIGVFWYLIINFRETKREEAEKKALEEAAKAG